MIARVFKGSPFSTQIAGVDHDELRAAVRELVDAEPRGRSELGRLLAERFPGVDANPLGYAGTYLVPLVQVPPRGVWGRAGRARWTTVERWLGEPVSAEASRADLVRRYLAAFGPASVRDIQNWSGLTRLKEVFEELRGELRVFYDQSGTELFDVPDGPLPDPDVPAPPRVLPTTTPSCSATRTARGSCRPSRPRRCSRTTRRTAAACSWTATSRGCGSSTARAAT